MNTKKEEFPDNIKKDILLKELTTFKVGGVADYFLEAKTQEDLIRGIKFAKQEKLPFFILGGGSNILVSDEGFRGIVIKTSFFDFEFFNTNKLKAQSGLNFNFLINECLKRGFSGIEWASGIPRITVGGSIYGNAGAFGTNIADIVAEVLALDAVSLEKKIFSFEDCKFGYKHSIFKENKNLVILSAIFNLEKKSTEEIEKEIRRVLDYRNSHHPKEYSAGSIFKNPFSIPAGELVEKAGLKGKNIGGAFVSEMHANFIINKGEAKAEDIKELINLVKETVKNKFGVELEEEIQYLGY